MGSILRKNYENHNNNEATIHLPPITYIKNVREPVPSPNRLVRVLLAPGLRPRNAFAAREPQLRPAEPDGGVG